MLLGDQNPVLRCRHRGANNVYSCEICNASDNETQSILSALLDKFIFIKTEGFSDPNQKQCDKIQVLNFQKLLKTVFAKKYNNFRETLSCNHENLKKYFCQRLNFRSEQLDKICDKITWRRAKYEYHLDVVNHQTKSFPRLFYSKLSEKSKQNIKKASSKNFVKSDSEFEIRQNVNQIPKKKQDQKEPIGTIPTMTKLLQHNQLPQPQQRANNQRSNLISLQNNEINPHQFVNQNPTILLPFSNNDFGYSFNFSNPSQIQLVFDPSTFTWSSINFPHGVENDPSRNNTSQNAQKER